MTKSAKRNLTGDFMDNGFFISIEGPDGAGKSTQIDLLKKHLKEKGYDVLETREPGGTPISEKIRQIILDKGNSEMASMTEALLYAASRAQLVAEVIKPALSQGKVVICDRYVDSSIAYQGYGRGLGESISVINDYAVDTCIPNLTLLFKLPPEIGSRRIDEKSKDRLESEKMKFHQDVYRGYLEIEKKFPDRVVGIDAAGSIEEIANRIADVVDGRLAKFEL